MFKMPLLALSANSMARSPLAQKLSQFRILKVLLILAVGMVLTTNVDAQNWSNWRGPEQNGVSRDTNLVDDWSFEPRKNVAWAVSYTHLTLPTILLV